MANKRTNIISSNNTLRINWNPLNCTYDIGVEPGIIGDGGGLVSSVFGRVGTITAQTGDYTVSQITGAAPLDSPNLIGIPLAPTAVLGTNNTQIATTAFVYAVVEDYVPPPLDVDPSPVNGSNNPVASNGVYDELILKATIDSPTFTGIPSGPTAAPGTNTTQLATTAFVTTAVNAVPTYSFVNGLGTLGESIGFIGGTVALGMDTEFNYETNSGNTYTNIELLASSIGMSYYNFVGTGDVRDVQILFSGQSKPSTDASIYQEVGIIEAADFDNNISHQIAVWPNRIELGNKRSLSDNVNSFIYVNGGDIEVTRLNRGIIIPSPDGTRWRITVDNAGVISTTSL